MECAINDTIEFYLKKLKEDGHDDEYDQLQKVRSDVINGMELSPRPPPPPGKYSIRMPPKMLLRYTMFDLQKRYPPRDEGPTFMF
jgi:hypothetical protein